MPGRVIARGRRHVVLLASLSLAPFASGLPQATLTFSHADTLRGSNTPERAWWDVAFYDLHVRINPSDSSVRGVNTITYRVVSTAREMQVDLQVPLVVDSIVQEGRTQRSRRDGNAVFVTLDAVQRIGTTRNVAVYYHGKPRVAVRPPWDGGLIWQHDSLGHTWVATACEGLGASVWWPNKDYLADEPDSQRIAITVPDSIVDVSNGRLRRTMSNSDGTTTYEWFVADPINNYDVEANAGVYAHFSRVYHGESGPLSLDFWPLAYHLDTATVQFRQVDSMLACFEHWFGPYPWYADGYKLIEAPHLGMEHQSGIAYGNHYVNGYFSRGAGIDLSGTGLGLTWDFIIVHESAHEWFGNSITAKDIADEWIHESFANYAEGLYTECQHGKQAGATYIIGNRRNVRNDSPIIGHYGVNNEGSGDMYYKGSNMLHTIRQIVANDDTWRQILRGLNQTFWHQTVTSKQIEDYVSAAAGTDLTSVFTQYLTTTMVPVLEYALVDSTLSYRWANVVPGFDMPVRLANADTGYLRVRPTSQWQTVTVHLSRPQAFHVDSNFYVSVRRVARSGSP